MFGSSSDISTNTVKKYSDTNYEYEISDIHAWRFEGGSMYDDFLLMNVSSESYSVTLPPNTSYSYTTLGVDGFDSGEVLDSSYYKKLFSKNYFWKDAESSGITINPNMDNGQIVDCNMNEPPCNDGYDGYYLWEFPPTQLAISPVLCFQHSYTFNFLSGSHSNAEIIEIPRHSITILEWIGSEDSLGDINSDGSVNILDAVVIVNMSIQGEYSSDADINNDDLVNILDVILVINIILDTE